ncbi:MAG: hypothetical protein AAGC46_03595 [Solirubrobacteraceae bacterium]|nr:hypothetical protein [Patulibacter sp.]
MPSTTIDVRREYTEADEAAIIDAVHAALVAAFRIPVEDKHLAACDVDLGFEIAV